MGCGAPQEQAASAWGLSGEEERSPANELLVTKVVCDHFKYGAVILSHQAIPAHGAVCHLSHSNCPMHALARPAVTQNVWELKLLGGAEPGSLLPCAWHFSA